MEGSILRILLRLPSVDSSGEGTLRVLDVLDGITTADMLGKESYLGGHVSTMRIGHGAVGLR